MSDETFEEWFGEIVKNPDYLGSNLAAMAWHYQQTKIDQLTKAVKKFEACCAFYGETSNWYVESSYTYNCEIDHCDIEESNAHAGKLARTTAEDQDIIDALKLIGEK